MRSARSGAGMVAPLVGCLLALTLVIGATAHASYQFVTKWGSPGSGEGEFHYPCGIAVSASGNVYVADTYNHRIQMFDSSGGFLTEWGSQGSDDGQFEEPRGMAVDASGNVYVTDFLNHRIQKFDSNGRFVRKWGWWGSREGEFNYPCGMAVDASGNVYVADAFNHRIQKFDGSGTFLAKWGSSGSGDGEFHCPRGVAVDTSGNVYVTDRDNDRVQKFASLPPVPPVLSWVGIPGFLNDGCDPNIGEAGTTRPTFKVRVTDKDGNAPTTVQVVLRKDGRQWRSYTLRPAPGSVGGSGRTYYCQLPEPLSPGAYKYRFRAKDDAGFATGPATVWQFGPSTYPQLAFSGEPDLDDGVKPNTGTADTTAFLWRVIYEDNDGDAPTYVQVRLWRDGTYYGALRMMTRDPAPDPIAGITYSARRRLPAGEYAYEFRAADKDGRARGPASQRMSGLTVIPATQSALLGIAALPTRSGAQVTFTLSAAAQVEAHVLNLAGRPVAAICHARECEAGTNVLLWSARSDSGLPVPNGAYLVEVSARSASGSQSRALATVRLLR